MNMRPAPQSSKKLGKISAHRGVFVTRDPGDTGRARTILRAPKMLGLRGEAGAVEVVGKYRIVLPLGQGGTADVYLAVAAGPSGFTKLVVIKVLRRNLASDNEFRLM